MTSKCQAILDAALELSEEDRGLLAERLLGSLDDLSTLSEDDLEAELLRRADECTRDPGGRVPWDELKNERP